MEIFTHCFTARPLAYAMSIQRMAMGMFLMGQTERKHTEDKRINWLRRTIPPDTQGKRRQPTWPKVNQSVLSSSRGVYELLLHGALLTASIKFQNVNSPIL